MKEATVIDMLPGEYWYAGVVSRGAEMPYGAETEAGFDLSASNYENQICTAMLSSAGRCLRFSPCRVEIAGGKISLFCGEESVRLTACGDTLKDAYRFACRAYFPPSGETLPEEFFLAPQFNDWMELGYGQNQREVVRYAEEIVSNGYPASIVMIDDGWADDYGSLTFHRGRFPAPREMFSRLRDLGFKVMLWESPFVSPDSETFRDLAAADLLVRDRRGEVALRHWWNGYSAVLDLSNPAAADYMAGKNAALLALGADGFKLDGGDLAYYRDDDVTFGGVSAFDQCRLYSEFARRYRYNELRASADMGGHALMQRACDKAHGWSRGGIADVVPGYLIQNLFGYWYAAPDMVGGGSIGTDKVVDEELVVRYAEAASMMAMMQFSRAPWRMLGEENNRLCLACARARQDLGPLILSLAADCAKTGEPIARPLEYEFPRSGFEREMNSFMLGGGLLVCPVTEKGLTRREVRLPPGRWRYRDGRRFAGGEKVTVDAPLGTLPFFEKIG